MASQSEETGGTCLIKTVSGGTAHGILLRTTENSLETHLGLKSEYARKCTVVLITNHHVIPNIVVARDCTILYGNEEIKLSGRELIDCISCCGYHGILGKDEHRKIKTGEASDCPFQLDFTVLFLNTSKCRLTTESLRTLHFSFDYDIEKISGLLGQTNKLECIQRRDDGRIITCDLTLSENQGKALYDQDNEVHQYINLANFTTIPHNEINEGSSGAPIFAYKSETLTKELVAIHRLTEKTIRLVVSGDPFWNKPKERSEPVAQKNTTIFWILWVIAIYQGTKHCISILI